MAVDRLKRVNELLRRELGQVFEVLVSPEIKTLVTVTDVRIAPDLREALVFVSVYGDEHTGKAVLTFLAKKRAHIQHDLSRKVILKYTPRLHFKLDQTAAKADRVMSILDTLQVDEAIHALAAVDARAAEVISMTYFAGLEREEIAKLMEVSASTIARALRFGRAWLKDALRERESG